VLPSVLPDWHAVLSGRAATAHASAPPPAALAKAATPPRSSRAAAAAQPKESARARAARERAAAAKAAREEEEEDGEQEEEEMDEGEVLRSMGKGPHSAEEIRRQRRCVWAPLVASSALAASAACRAPLQPPATHSPQPTTRAYITLLIFQDDLKPRVRPPLPPPQAGARAHAAGPGAPPHPYTRASHKLTAAPQIDALRSASEALSLRLRDSDNRCDALSRENAALRGELERQRVLQQSGAAVGTGEPAAKRQHVEAPAPSALRVAAPGAGGEEAAAAGALVDSPAAGRGFVPFRSLKSYENLLRFAAEAQALVGAEGAAA